MLTRRALFTSTASALAARTTPFQPAFATARQAALAIRQKKISSLELTSITFSRIDKYNPTLNAFVYQLRDQALSAARRADAALAQGRSLSPLHGVPISIKECFGIEGQPATFGIPQFRKSKAPRNAAAVQKLVDAGAVLLGATNVPTFLWDWQSTNPIYGRTNNPWNPDRTPGGSSGGSAAALAAGLGQLSLGGDLAGSLRVPAHFCGVFSHKSTVGTVSRLGLAPGGKWDLPGSVATLDVVGPMARSAGDLVDALHVLAGPDSSDTTAWSWRLAPPRHNALRDFRTGFVFEGPFGTPSSEQQPAFQSVLSTLQSAGLSPRPGWPDGFQPAAALNNYLFLLAAFSEEFFPPPMLAAMKQTDSPFSAGIGAPHSKWVQQDRLRLLARLAWQKYFESHDVFLCPVAIVPAFPHDPTPSMEARKLQTPEGPRPYLSLFSWASFATLAGLPATVMPIGKTASGLPVGLQIVGPLWEDATPIRFAELLSERLGGFSPPPRYDA